MMTQGLEKPMRRNPPSTQMGITMKRRLRSTATDTKGVRDAARLDSGAAQMWGTQQCQFGKLEHA